MFWEYSQVCFVAERLRELNSNNSTAVAASASEDMSTDVPSSCLNASTNTDASTQCK